jgi:hypothetical protein
VAIQARGVGAARDHIFLPAADDSAQSALARHPGAVHRGRGESAVPRLRRSERRARPLRRTEAMARHAASAALVDAASAPDPAGRRPRVLQSTIGN